MILSFSRLKSDAFLVPTSQDMATYHKTQGYPNHPTASQVHMDAIVHISYESNMQVYINLTIIFLNG